MVLFFTPSRKIRVTNSLSTMFFGPPLFADMYPISSIIVPIYRDGFRCFFLSTHQGNNVPPPFTSFDATGLPSELLREVWISL